MPSRGRRSRTVEQRGPVPRQPECPSQYGSQPYCRRQSRPRVRWMRGAEERGSQLPTAGRVDGAFSGREPPGSTAGVLPRESCSGVIGPCRGPPAPPSAPSTHRNISDCVPQYLSRNCRPRVSSVSLSRRASVPFCHSSPSQSGPTLLSRLVTIFWFVQLFVPFTSSPPFGFQRLLAEVLDSAQPLASLAHPVVTGTVPLCYLLALVVGLVGPTELSLCHKSCVPSSNFRNLKSRLSRGRSPSFGGDPTSFAVLHLDAPNGTNRLDPESTFASSSSPPIPWRVQTRTAAMAATPRPKTRRKGHKGEAATDRAASSPSATR